jgi:hypothetical protein
MKNTCLIIFLWITAGLAQAQIKPADGLWRTTDDPDIGSGMMMITQGGITLATVFSYTENGQPRWYLAVGSVDENGRFQAELNETTDGTSIVVNNPPSASYLANPRQLTIDFYGSQSASFQIDEQPVKTMQSVSIASATWDTEHQTLNDGTPYQVSDPAGTWVVGGIDTDEAFVLDLEPVEDPAANAAFTEKSYVSSHPSTTGWELRCPWQFMPNTLPFSQPFCVLDRQQEGLPMLNVAYADLGVKQMQLVAADESQSFTGFRPASVSLQPSDGYWRPEDDPDIGGGLVLVSQGPYTVVLMYSYDEVGNAAWSIAAGAFDANGLLQTELRHTTGGSPIGIDGKTSAVYTEQVQQLEIQLLGTELATFSVDGAPAKHIQNVNFGAYLFSTEHFKVGDMDYKFPALSGWWVLADSAGGPPMNLNIESYNGSATPWPPTSPRMYSNRAFDSNAFFHFQLHCHRLIVDQPLSGCTGSGGYNDSDDHLFMHYFQDIGNNHLRIYYGNDLNEINRTSPHFDLYRLD